MDSTIAAALIAGGMALVVFYLGKRKEVITERLKDRQKREGEEEAKRSKYNNTLVDHMCTIRNASRDHIAGFMYIQLQIESAGDGPSQEEVRSIFTAVRGTISVHTDVALEVGLTFPAVRDAWFRFDGLRTQYMEGVDGYTCDRNSRLPGELQLLLDEVTAARKDLVEEMKVAAKRLGRSLLVRDADLDDQGAS
ncbi:hypothetical protein GKQ77_17585 [Streptomyces sp. BG9H]|uniref:Secreted protein n=1 Tax=Streptomyces anatolicus TaxID=2675858 RepID=A0ABS6YS31_9ACTN|nr:hypothetical protein [Streptomyces anatolicus]MBW5423356.1 hypothetical protein [Streptomyces anatolicus]